jgi:hypothetical protein
LKFVKITVLLLVVLCLGGNGDDRLFGVEPDPSAATAAAPEPGGAVLDKPETPVFTEFIPVSTPPEVLETVEVSTPPGVSEPPGTADAVPETADFPLLLDYGDDRDYTLTDEMSSFTDGCVFVGDSICYGLEVYGFIPESRSLAKGNVSVWNIFTYKPFKCSDGAERWIADALAFEKPATVVFWMGMNDVNLVSKETHAENYRNLILTARERSPQSRIIVMSISPVSEDCEFTTVGKIAEYNAVVKDMVENGEIPDVFYVDLDAALKASDGYIRENHAVGVHLNTMAYKKVLYRLAEVMTEQ